MGIVGREEILPEEIEKHMSKNSTHPPPLLSQEPHPF